MSEQSERISKLLHNQESRASYISSKLAVLVPAQIRTLRLKSIEPPMPYQKDLAQESGMQQSRISMFETPGAANMTLETIAKIAAALRVGVVLKFVPFHDMLRWENSFSPDAFDVQRLQDDEDFIHPEAERTHENAEQLGGLDYSFENEAGAMKIGKTAHFESLKPPPSQNAIGA